MKCLSTALLSCLLLVAIVGCASTDESRFYLLSSIPAGSVANDMKIPGIKIRVIVELAEYAERPEIVTRAGANRYEFADYHRWAESPRENISRVLTQNLSLLLGSQHVIAGEWPSSNADDFRIEVKFTRLDGAVGQEGAITGRWRLLDSTGKKVLVMRTSDFTETTDGDDYEAFVGAQSRALANFSKEVARAIKSKAPRNAKR